MCNAEKTISKKHTDGRILILKQICFKAEALSSRVADFYIYNVDEEARGSLLLSGPAPAVE